MPIRRYVEHGVVFTPEVLSTMSNAFTAATEVLEIGGDEIKRAAVARFIIRLAQEDGNLDAAALRDRAVAVFGGPIFAVVINERHRVEAASASGSERPESECPSRGIALCGDEPHDGRRDPEPKGPWEELDRDGPIMSKAARRARAGLSRCGISIRASSTPRLISDDEWNGRNEARRAAVLEAIGISGSQK